jgi:L-seryl-tRNA(Ser) seleniumtransferase
MRIDKLCLAGLEATLRLYSQGREAEIPTLRYLSRPVEEVHQVAIRLASCVRNSVITEGVTEVGGGSAPGTTCPTWRVGLSSHGVDELAKRLRLGDPPVFARIEQDLVWLDPRTLDDDEVESVCEVLKSL